jgi:DNA recombination protein RmuC
MEWILGILVGLILGAVIALLWAHAKRATLEERLRSTQQNLIEQKNLLDDAQSRMKETFASVSQDVLQQSTQQFLELAKAKFESLTTEASGDLEQRKTAIEGMLKPLQEVMLQYQTRLAEIEQSRNESYGALKEHLGKLTEAQRTLFTQTNQLVTALRRPSTRGQWGEITLKRLVELAGMTNRVDFLEQMNIATEEGRLRPDMVVHLPGKRQVVVDCKASLDAFLDAAACSDEDKKKDHLLRHSQHVRLRGRELCSKAYWNQFDASPEFVVMFLPGESFFSAAIEMDPNLYEDCLKSRVIVATPTTLLALLRSIEYGWKQSDMAENAEEIRKLGSEIYARMLTFADHLQRVGSNLDNAVSAYNNAVSSMETRVLVSVRKMGELGARSDKPVPALEQIDKKARELQAITRAGE